jgi:dynein heavy chain
MHSKYLQNYVGQQLTELHVFLKNVNDGLDVNVEAGDRESMMEVMKSIRDVRKRTPQISCLFEPLRDIVTLLKNKSVVIEIPNVGTYAALDYLDQAKVFWEGTVNKTYRVKEALQPLMNGMLTHIIKEIKTFNANVAKFVKDFKKSGPFSLELEQREAYASIDGYQKEVSKLLEGAKTLNELEDLFELPLSSNRSIDEVHDNLSSLKGVWDVVALVDSLFSSWKTTFWVDLKCDNLIQEVRLVQNQLKKHAKKPREWPVFKMLELNVKNMATILPLLHELRSPAMRERHWKSLQVTTCATFDRGPTFCLDDLLALNLHRHVEAVTDIVEVANKELKIESKLLSIQEVWKNLTLRFDRHRDTEVFVVSAPVEVLETLEEHYLHLQAMSGMGKFVDFFRDQVVKWQTTLGEVETVLKLVLLVQRQWASLESIFLGSADIRSQLPDDTKRFEIMDSEFKSVMKDLQGVPGVVQCCTTDGREPVLRSMTRELEKCERALNEYLEVKKTIFPRFYFVSNAALLDILSNGNNPPVIMLHIGSVFDGIGDMELSLSATQRQAMKEDPEGSPGPPEAARSMVSKDKEVVPFPAPFECRGAVENWLNELVKYMQLTLKNVLSTSMNDAASWDVVKTREEWVSSVPAQIALLTTQIMWTEEVEDALEELEGGQDDSVKKYSDVCVTRLEGLIRLVQGELSKGDRVKVITVITIDVHSRDVVSDLIKKKVESSLDFKWQSQLRYYFVPTDNTVNIRICDFATVYSYEYTGNCGRLVITPLTDRCYVTLTTALRLMLGGAPAGPAGTGKTETTKDLARGLGLPCYVFNCSDQMNYQTMGDIFKGLTQSGAWGCFDEFNRIEIEVLSVVASQVKSILDAIGFFSTPMNRPREYQGLPAGTPATKVGSFLFFGDEVSLVPTCGFFITMNPGYAGRTELPENLKALFRSCAMIQPDTVPIAENMLMAEGFVKARPLSVNSSPCTACRPSCSPSRPTMTGVCGPSSPSSGWPGC